MGGIDNRRSKNGISMETSYGRHTPHSVWQCVLVTLDARGHAAPIQHMEYSDIMHTTCVLATPDLTLFHEVIVRGNAYKILI